jgi:hypothetical protein
MCNLEPSAGTSAKTTFQQITSETKMEVAADLPVIALRIEDSRSVSSRHYPMAASGQYQSLSVSNGQGLLTAISGLWL